MKPCLLCDIKSVARGSADAPICASHQQQAQAAFGAADPILRAHLERMYGDELDGWVQRGVLPGLAWQLQMRDHAPSPTHDLPEQRPGRPLHFRQQADSVVRPARELVLQAMQQEVLPHEPAVVLRVGSPDSRWTAGVDAETARAALQNLVAELVTVEKLQAVLKALPLEAAERAIIDACVRAETEADELVARLDVLSKEPERSLSCVCWRLPTACSSTRSKLPTRRKKGRASSPAAGGKSA